MAKGKKPLLPPRNSLLQGTGHIGKKPPLPYREALQQRRERLRLEKITKGKTNALSGPLGVILPTMNPRAAAKTLMAGTHERAERRAKRKAEKASARMQDEMQRVGFKGTLAEFTAGHDELPQEHAPTNRPPRQQAGRYDGLKNGGEREPT